MNSSTRQEKQELFEMLKTPYEETAAGKFLPGDENRAYSRFSEGEGVDGDIINLGDSRNSRN